MATEKILDNDFADLARVARTEQRESSGFGIDCHPDGPEAWLWAYSNGGRVVGNAIEVPKGHYGFALGEHVSPINGAEDGAEKYSLFQEQASTVTAHLNESARLSLANSRDLPKRRNFPEEERNPCDVDIHGAAKRIGGIESERLLFYTGAGMSKAGKNPIETHESLRERWGIHHPTEPRAFEHNKAFIQSVLADGTKAREVQEAYRHFIDSMYFDESTLAHKALAKIVLAYDLQPTIVTTNHDLKHQAEGSRLSATKLRPGWHPEDGTTPGIRSLAGKIDLVVSIGSAADTRGFYDFLGPDVEVLAINTQAAIRIPYLRRSDSLLRGDVQAILPAIARAIIG